MGVAIARMIPGLFLSEVYVLVGRNSYEVDVKDLYPLSVVENIRKTGFGVCMHHWYESKSYFSTEKNNSISQFQSSE